MSRWSDQKVRLAELKGLRMETSKKGTGKKLAPAVREIGEPKQTNALLTNLRTLHECIGMTLMVTVGVGEKVQPLVALMYSARTPTIDWRSRSLSALRGLAHG